MRRQSRILILCLCAFFVSTSAQALKPGCGPDFIDAQTKIAKARQLADASRNQEIFEQPASVFQMSCFLEAMANSSQAGNIFSDSDGRGGSLTGTVIDIIGNRNSLGTELNHSIGFSVERWLSDNYSEPGSAGADLSQYIVNRLTELAIAIGQDIFGWTGLSFGFTCDGIQRLREKKINLIGINPKAPAFTLDDIMSGGFAGAGQTALDNIQKSIQLFGDAQDSLDSMRAGQFSGFESVPDLKGANINQVRNFVCGGPC